MQETRHNEEHIAEIFEEESDKALGRDNARILAEMNDALMKQPQQELIKRTFFKDKKSARKAQRKARKANRGK